MDQTLIKLDTTAVPLACTQFHASYLPLSRAPQATCLAAGSAWSSLSNTAFERLRAIGVSGVTGSSSSSTVWVWLDWSSITRYSLLSLLCFLLASRLQVCPPGHFCTGHACRRAPLAPSVVSCACVARPARVFARFVVVLACISSGLWTEPTETTIAQTPGSEEPEYGFATPLALPCRRARGECVAWNS